VRLLAIMLNRQHSIASHDYVVYYIDDVNTPIMPGLEFLTRLKVKDWSLVGNALVENRQTLETAGLDVNVFDDVTLLQLMAPDRGNKIVWLVDTKGKPSPQGKKAEDLFTEKRNVEYITGRNVTVEATDQGWKIKHISTIVVKDD
jgi:hypothetical protein